MGNVFGEKDEWGGDGRKNWVKTSQRIKSELVAELIIGKKVAWGNVENKKKREEVAVSWRGSEERN